MNGWDTLAVEATVANSRGTFDVELERRRTSDGWEFVVHGDGERAVTDLTFRCTTPPSFSEVFVTAPNMGGVELVHPLQTIYLGLGEEHRDAMFGKQWIFSPPPLVLPVRVGEVWYGMAISAPSGKNSYSGCTYRPRACDRVVRTAPPGAPEAYRDSVCCGADDSVPTEFEIEVHYDGYTEVSGQVLTFHVLAEACDTPYDVVRWYAERLRESDAAPTPDRRVARWWHEPMFCQWGEQCNQAHAKRPAQWMEESVTMYETDANQRRWLHVLESQSVPVGVVTLSDKWQLHRERLVPDTMKYPDLRGFVDEQHGKGRKVIAWLGLWRFDDPPAEWCIRSADGERLALDPQSPGYAAALEDGVGELIGPDGYDVDGFFLDFTADLPCRSGLVKSGDLWGIELLHHYVALIHRAAKAAKSDAMIMTHCCHPYFADVTDVLRLNDWAFKRPDIVEQAYYRHGVATSVSDWLINTDNWFMYDIEEWRRYLPVQPRLGIPASWFAGGIRGDGTGRYEPFTDEDYLEWSRIWSAYRAANDLE